MSEERRNEVWFEQLAASDPDEPEVRAPSRLKSKIYSELMLRHAETGPILSVTETPRLCVFESCMKVAPVGEDLRQKNYCRICHARLLGEKVENAPIYWPNCPYVGFQNR